MIRLAFLPSLLLLCSAVSAATEPASLRTSQELAGRWLFFPDYFSQGETYGWQKPVVEEATWDTVEVPHIWNLEPRYDYTGPAWYRHKFQAPAIQSGRHAFLHFGAVFYKAKVWLNGTVLGEHEGGYTAFDLDASAALKPGAENVLVVRVDNSWSTETIPGARVGINPRDLTYPWWNYGGIKKPVHLVVTAPAFIVNQKIVATPDLAAGTAAVSVLVRVRNTSASARRQRIRLRIRRPGAWDPLGSAESSIDLPPAATTETTLSVALPASAVALWDFDHPNLYQSLVELLDAAGATDQHLTRFGIRLAEVRGARLLLNGEPVAFGGANRVADHPKFGSLETPELIDQDLSLMKTANMGLARILHYPCSPTLLDWADEHGFLIIAEPGNWGLIPQQLDSESIRANWKRQAREMIEEGWNHPSVIAWSTGNEYQSDTPAGVRWTRDMLAYIRTLDTSRLLTFVSLGGKVFSKVKPEENSFHYVDFLCANIYGNDSLGKAMETLHDTWPDKPVLISEFGWREDTAQSEAWRARQFRDAMAILRRYPFVIGASVWSWNDYRSRHYGTNTDGYRHWGLVSPNREPRGSYFAVRDEFSPAILSSVVIDRKPDGLSANFAVRVGLLGRTDFPSRVLRDHEIVVTLLRPEGTVRKQITHRVPILHPGDKLDLAIPVSPFDLSAASRVKVEVRQPTGYTSVERTIEVQGSTDAAR